MLQYSMEIDQIMQPAKRCTKKLHYPRFCTNISSDHRIVASKLWQNSSQLPPTPM